MFGDIKFDLVCLLTLLVFCLIKKGYEILVKKNKTTQVVLFLQLGVCLLFLVTFKLTIFTVLCLIMLVLFSHIFIIDSKYYIIPYSSIIGIFVLAIINFFIENVINVSILNRIISFAIFLLLWLLLTLIQNKIKKEFLGGGDLMLFCVVSLFLGGLITIIGIFIGSLIALIFNLFNNKKKKLPFGPYLVVGFILALLIYTYIFI